MRRPLDVPPDWEIGFVSFVRASGRGEAACLRERDYASLRWVKNYRTVCVSGVRQGCAVAVCVSGVC